MMELHLSGARHVQVGADRFAYRTFGPDVGVPLVLLQRFRGTMDHWDPLLIDALAARRRVIVFDNVGVGASSGVAPPHISGMADATAELIGALGFESVDLFGWSMGGCVAQRTALRLPEIVRRLVLAGTSPGGVSDAPAAPPRVWEVAAKAVNDDDDFLYLFFHDSATSRQEGTRHLARLARGAGAPRLEVSGESVKNQARAIAAWGSGHDGVLDELASIAQPALVANGVHDRMVHAYNSYILAQRLPDADLVLFADAGHGFLFQYARRFGNLVADFLDRPDRRVPQ